MTSFDKRESAFEAEFAHREELKFRAREYAVASLAQWAAQRLGKSGEAAETYAREIMAADVANPTVALTIDRIAADLGAAGISAQEVRRVMDRFLAEAEAAARVNR
ncbi:DUF1476 domain-containing protein [Bradyrhizobium sp. BR13661]|uniref:DUF1476 domain-containing protein n=1 Tax=Bradyrhizobium sp. BR13661 TaxID=2940622 RepID=UPI0024744DE7|nr:DUF1476 domain-containing protein [Bradyrhizobium sp. BR13661]